MGSHAGPTDGRVCVWLRLARDAEWSGPVCPTDVGRLARGGPRNRTTAAARRSNSTAQCRSGRLSVPRQRRARSFQAANDLQFVLESVRDLAPTPVGKTEARRTRSTPAWWLAGAAALTLGVGSLLISRRNEQAPVRPSIRTSVVVPASARPIAPALSPDGKWLAYVGLGDGRPDLFTQFVNGGAPVNLTLEADMPVQNRTIVGGIDVLPDGSASQWRGDRDRSASFRCPASGSFRRLRGDRHGASPIATPAFGGRQTVNGSRA